MNNQQNKSDSVVGVGLPLNAVRTGKEVLKQAHEALLACLDATWEEKDGLTVFAEDRLPSWVYTEACQAVTAIEASLGAVSVPSETAAGAQKQDHPSEIVELEQEASLMRARNERLQQERDALLEALTRYVALDDGCGLTMSPLYEDAKKAIAKAEGRA